MQRSRSKESSFRSRTQIKTWQKEPQENKSYYFRRQFPVSHRFIDFGLNMKNIKEAYESLVWNEGINFKRNHLMLDDKIKDMCNSTVGILLLLQIQSIRHWYEGTPSKEHKYLPEISPAQSSDLRFLAEG